MPYDNRPGAPPPPPPPSSQTHAEGHQQGHRSSHKRPARLGLIAIVAVLLAAAAAAWGIVSRRHADAALAVWTGEQAVPTVTVALPTHDAAARTLVLPGDVRAFYEASIYARVSGYLANWTQDIGAHVHAGQVLATIDTPDLDQEMAQVQADLATAQARSALADLTARRWHALLASNSVSVQSADEKQGDALAQHAEVNAQRAHVDRLRALEGFKRIVAPFDGVVTARNTDVGALITGGSSATMPLFKVADMHEMRVYVRVPQAYASELHPGMTATLTEPQYPGRQFQAKLTTTSQSVATESRTVLAELMAPNADGTLWAGTFAEVSFDVPANAAMLRVPSSALIFRSHGAQLATVGPDGTVVLKDVTVGRNLGTEIEIERGITATDRIVTTPLDTIEDGDSVVVAGAQGSPQAATQVAPQATP
jgi:RND family efflux transporter MFP subunit